MASQLPGRYELDYLLYSLSDGDITKSEEIAERFTRGEATKWLMLRKYEAYMTDRATRGR